MKNLAIILGLVLAFGGGYLVRTHSEPETPSYGSIATEKAAIVVKYVEAKERLKESAEIDANLNTGEVTSALNSLKDNYGITVADLAAARWNVSTALRTKFAAQSIICNNPNSSAQGPKDTKLTVPAP